MAEWIFYVCCKREQNQLRTFDTQNTRWRVDGRASAFSAALSLVGNGACARAKRVTCVDVHAHVCACAHKCSVCQREKRAPTHTIKRETYAHSRVITMATKHPSVTDKRARLREEQKYPPPPSPSGCRDSEVIRYRTGRTTAQPNSSTRVCACQSRVL